MKGYTSIKVLFFMAFYSGILLSQNVNLSNGVIFDGEPYIEIDPTNSAHLVVAWMSFAPRTRKVSIKLRVSFDGGATWGEIQTIPHVHDSNTSADPSIAFDNNGNVFLSFVDYNKDSARGAVFIVKSTDGGLTWGTPVEVINSDADLQKPIDRPWISVDRSGGLTDGNIYVTTMPPRVFGYLPPPYHPYLSVSTDRGNSFSWRYVDTTGWLSGNLIRQPMATLCVASDGVLHVVYPSYVPSQDSLFRFIHASSNDGGQSFSYNTLLRTNSFVDDTLVKKGYLILADPSNPEHLAFVFLAKPYGDIDVFLTESFDGGITWSDQTRVNDDPVGNNRIQDMLWADFDNDGDLAIAWRDRRNGEDSTYQTSYEIWGAVKWKDSTGFSRNFRISDTLIPYHPFVALSGNDFMCVRFLNDTIYAVWGDTRSGKMDVYFQKMTPSGTIGIRENDQLEEVTEIPILLTSSKILIKADRVTKVRLFSADGRLLFQKSGDVKVIKLNRLPHGIYFINVQTENGTMTQTLINLR